MRDHREEMTDEERVAGERLRRRLDSQQMHRSGSRIQQTPNRAARRAADKRAKSARKRNR